MAILFRDVISDKAHCFLSVFRALGLGVVQFSSGILANLSNSYCFAIKPR